ncbi:MAG TPA: AAA family ATPase [Candidatus Binatia bacterium]
MFFRFFRSGTRKSQRILTKSPFEPASGVQPFCINDAYREAFIAVRYGIELRLGLIVLSGESGVGKTTLVKLVGESARQKVRLVVLSAREPASSLLGSIMAGLGLHVPRELRAGTQALKKYLLQQFKRGQIVAILIDDADELRPEAFAELKTLLSLRSEGKHLVQIVLAGSPALASLDVPGLKSLRQRIRITSRIPPLTTHEVEAYIEQKLSLAGGDLRDLFRPGAVTRIATRSQGIPKTIDALCNRAFRLAYRRSEKHITESIVEDAWQILQSGGESEIERPAEIQEPRTLPNTAHYAHVLQASHGTVSETFPGAQSRSAVQAITALASAWRCWTDRASQLIKAIERLPPIRNYASSPLAPRPHQMIGAILVAGAAAALLLWSAFTPAPEPELVQQAHNFFTEPEATLRSPPIDEPPAISLEQPETRTTPVDDTVLATDSRSPQVWTRTEARSGELVYLHTSHPEDFRAIEDIGAALRGEGYVVRDIRFTTNSTQGDVRFFFTSDRQAAQRVKNVVESELQTRGYWRRLQLLERDGRRFRFAAPGKIEVWLPPLSRPRPN